MLYIFLNAQFCRLMLHQLWTCKLSWQSLQPKLQLSFAEFALFTVDPATHSTINPPRNYGANRIGFEATGIETKNKLFKSVWFRQKLKFDILLCPRLFPNVWVAEPKFWLKLKYRINFQPIGFIDPYAGTWVIDERHISNPGLWPSFFVICPTGNNLSGILNTMDTSFLPPRTVGSL